MIGSKKKKKKILTRFAIRWKREINDTSKITNDNSENSVDFGVCVMVVGLGSWVWVMIKN